jgi:DNA helicase HerA-like ATPase
MLDKQNRALIAVNERAQLFLLPKMANRHGLVTGATGTGKTITLQSMAETFSQMGVPVFASDVKGDLSGLAASGGGKASVAGRVAEYGLADCGFAYQSYPVRFWDVFGTQGLPVRAAVKDLGPLLLSRLLNLNDTQNAVLTLVFKFAADRNLDIVDLKDLRKLLEYVAGNASEISSCYGNVSGASIGAIQRGLIRMEQEGAEQFFGEPGLDIQDFLQCEGGKGVVNILAADRLMNSPIIYSSFLLWLLSRLFDQLPETGDQERPKLVFFFDEAHLLFRDASKAMLEKVEQVARLIRSKGVGVYFISQSSSDIPDSILGQLGNRVQHALRAYTPKDRKVLKAAAASFRPNPTFDEESAIAELAVGEALVSFLDEGGAPRVVERAFIVPPQGGIGPLEVGARAAMIKNCPLYPRYAQSIDRRSAYEILSDRMSAPAPGVGHSTAKEQENIRKAEEKENKARQKEEKRESRQRERFWSGIVSRVVVPVARQALKSLFK